MESIWKLPSYQFSELQAPAHLKEGTWLEFEQSRALAFCPVLSKELNKLCHKDSAKQVHDARVIMRRWMAIWSVLKQDGWQSKKLKRQSLRKISRLLQLLGKLRDWDVCLELAPTFGCSQALQTNWSKQRRKIHKKVRHELQDFDPDRLVRKIERHLISRLKKLEKQVGKAALLHCSAYKHLSSHLSVVEHEVSELEQVAHTPEQLHRLRLSIKGWRYFLTEFFGLTNLDLVKAQQLLGKVHDLSTMESLISGKKDWPAATKIRRERKRFLREFNKIRNHLPYGLRPGVSSLAL